MRKTIWYLNGKHLLTTQALILSSYPCPHTQNHAPLLTEQMPCVRAQENLRVTCESPASSLAVTCESLASCVHDLRVFASTCESLAQSVTMQLRNSLNVSYSFLSHYLWCYSVLGQARSSKQEGSGNKCNWVILNRAARRTVNGLRP